VAPGCPHCAVVLEGLVGLVKDAALERLEVINIAAAPEEGRRLGVRSVPWTRIGEFDLAGLYSPVELRQWAEASGTEAGMARYFDGLVREGRRDSVEAMVRREPRWIGALLALLADPQTGIHARLGVMATLEELADSGALRDYVDRIGELTARGEARLRIDALHALSLTASPAAAGYARACLGDPDPGVREAAEEALHALVSHALGPSEDR
jgi:hypothetical protein